MGLFRNFWDWLWCIDREPPKPPTRLKWSIKRIYTVKVTRKGRIVMVRKADVRLSWFPSVSTDVQRQHLDVFVNGVVAVNTDLSPEESGFLVVGLVDNDDVQVQLTATDNSMNVSKPAVLAFNVGVLPDNVAPEAPTDLAWALDRVYEE